MLKGRQSWSLGVDCTFC